MHVPLSGKYRWPQAGPVWPWGQELQIQLFKVNPQIIVNVDLDFVLEGIGFNFKIILFPKIHEYFLLIRIYNPVLPHSGIHVKVQLAYIVMS